MAYITSESVKEIRNEIKKNFPASKGWKFSITRENYSSVNCTIIQAPIDLLANKERTHENVNEYYIDNSERSFEAKEVLKQISGILNTNNFDKSDPTTDYFHVGHYTNLTVGCWNKPFIKTN
jgi:hypothetical protein